MTSGSAAPAWHSYARQVLREARAGHQLAAAVEVTKLLHARDCDTAIVRAGSLWLDTHGLPRQCRTGQHLVD
ncbi:hypothetical protein ACFXG4_52320 [Nocardia sp. NPDC059246]|uniref:hypothetical protein n=1 Tax=unclassified Nocardia TaxID=2637762 RepID=UPI003690E996